MDRKGSAAVFIVILAFLVVVGIIAWAHFYYLPYIGSTSREIPQNTGIPQGSVTSSTQGCPTNAAGLCVIQVIDASTGNPIANTTITVTANDSRNPLPALQSANCPVSGCGIGYPPIVLELNSDANGQISIPVNIIADTFNETLLSSNGYQTKESVDYMIRVSSGTPIMELDPDNLYITKNERRIRVYGNGGDLLSNTPFSILLASSSYDYPQYANGCVPPQCATVTFSGVTNARGEIYYPLSSTPIRADMSATIVSSTLISPEEAYYGFVNGYVPSALAVETDGPEVMNLVKAQSIGSDPVSISISDIGINGQGGQPRPISANDKVATITIANNTAGSIFLQNVTFSANEITDPNNGIWLLDASGNNILQTQGISASSTPNTLFPSTSSRLFGFKRTWGFGPQGVQIAIGQTYTLTLVINDTLRASNCDNVLTYFDSLTYHPSAINESLVTYTSPLGQGDINTLGFCNY